MIHDEETLKAAIEAGIFHKAQNLFLSSSTNNILHNQYVAMLSTVLDPPSGQGFMQVS